MSERPYQTRTLNLIRHSIAKGNKKILVVSPTGSGKGWVASRLMELAAEKDNRSIFFSDRRELVIQLYDQLVKTGVDSEILLASYTKEFQGGYTGTASCTAISKDTLWSRAWKRDRIEKPDNVSIVQFDEAHRSLSKTFKAIGDHYSDSILIGWTATPCRTDGKGLGDYYEDLIVSATYEELQEQGWLVPCRIWQPHTVDTTDIKPGWDGDYQKKALEERVKRDLLVGDVIKDWKNRSEDRKTILFAASVEHSIYMRNEFIKHGIKAEHIDSKNTSTNEREDILGGFKTGDTTVLCNFGIVTEGVDVPEAKYIINCRPTKSFGLWRQMAGRAQRPFTGHDHFRIQDHSDCAVRFGFPDEDVAWTLETGTKSEDLPRKKKNTPPDEPREPYQCERCLETYRGYACPECGHKPVRRGKSVKMNTGLLREMKRKQSKKPKHSNAGDSLIDKQKFLNQLIGEAIGKERKMNYVAKLFKDRYGCWPNQLKKIVGAPSALHMQTPARDFYRDVIAPLKLKQTEKQWQEKGEDQ